MVFKGIRNFDIVIDLDKVSTACETGYLKDKRYLRDRPSVIKKDNIGFYIVGSVYTTEFMQVAFRSVYDYVYLVYKVQAFGNTVKVRIKPIRLNI